MCLYVCLSMNKCLKEIYICIKNIYEQTLLIYKISLILENIINWNITLYTIFPKTIVQEMISIYIYKL